MDHFPGESLRPTADHERRHDRQRQRHPHAHRRTDASRAGDVDGAADRLDVRLHHVHADTATGHARHLGGRGESGLEDALQHPLVGERLGRRGVDEPTCHRLRADGFDGDAGAIVLHLDRDLPALVEGPEPESAGPWLAGRLADFGSLDPMVDGIANQVRERIANPLHERPIELRVGPVDDQLHLAAAGHGQVPHRPRKLVEDVLDGLHPRLDSRLLEGRGDGVDAVHGSLECRVATGDAPQFVAGEHQFADQIQNRGEQPHIDADRRVDRGGNGPRGILEDGCGRCNGCDNGKGLRRRHRHGRLGRDGHQRRRSLRGGGHCCRLGGAGPRHDQGTCRFVAGGILAGDRHERLGQFAVILFSLDARLLDHLHD